MIKMMCLIYANGIVCRLTEEEKRNAVETNSAIRGVLAEVALTGYIRYPWDLLIDVVRTLMEVMLDHFADEEGDDPGPPRPLINGLSFKELRSELSALLLEFPAAPFTLQRLSEVLLEPKKHYNKLDKFVLALDRLIHVSSTIDKTDSKYLPPMPKLSSLGSVNENPKSPYDGEPPAGPLPQSMVQGTYEQGFSNEEYDMYLAGHDVEDLYVNVEQSEDEMKDDVPTRLHGSDTQMLGSNTPLTESLHGDVQGEVDRAECILEGDHEEDENHDGDSSCPETDRNTDLLNVESNGMHAQTLNSSTGVNIDTGPKPPEFVSNESKERGLDRN